MSTAAIIYLVLTAVSGVAMLMLHGERTEYNFFSSMIATGLILGLLYWGGFFDPVHACDAPEPTHTVEIITVVPDGYKLVPVEQE